ncbi:hypothetical protein C818_02162 [Lachnospiraceae bacterium MD308]|nr:hypothetical protein C818_02162 [Lachnospiraceae bacterium MD308]
MSNILRVTTPMAGNYDNMSQPRADMQNREDPRIQGPVNPNKVVRADARSDSAAEEQNVGLKFQYQSNFEGFISQMKSQGVMTEEFATVFFEQLSNQVKAGMSEGFAQEIAQFLEMIQVDPENMLAFLKEQGDAAIRFQGAFFSLLRQAMNDTKNVELRAGILDFMKRYTDMAEGKHILREIEQTIKELKSGMLQSGREKMEEMEQQLKFGGNAGPGSTEENASLIKGKMLPYLNKYIGGTHDRGSVREGAAFLAALTARYENGDAARVLERFEQLMEYSAMQKYFKGFETQSLLKVLEATDFEKTIGKNKWMKGFVSLIQNGMQQGANIEQKQVFRNMMTSILLNESVYMPVLHMMLPMQVNDNLTFAEMWVDPDAGKNSGGKEKERIIQGLVKFDIQDVGFFDLFFVYQDKKVNMQLNYPDALKDKEKEIRNKVAEALAENGLTGQELFFGSSKDSIAISEAFPQIFERKNSINVKI